MTHTNHQYRTFLSCLFSASFLGAVLGIVDFAIFEVFSDHSTIVESALTKPSFVSLSYFSYQILIFIVLSIAFFSAFSITRFFGKRFESIFQSGYPLFLAVASLSIMIISLRFLKNRQQISEIFILAVVSAFLFLIPIVANRRPSMMRILHFSTNSRVQSSFLCVVILVSFFAPDLYHLVPPARDDSGPEVRREPNVILIVLDTVRADHLSCYGYEKKTTPYLDAIARDGLLFLNAYTTAPWTVPSHASMFTGLYTSDHHVDWGHTFLDDSFLTIAEYLLDHEYETAGFTENPFIGRAYGFNQGFSEFHEVWRRPMIMRGLAELLTRANLRKERMEYSGRTTGLVRRWIDRRRDNTRPFFMFVNLMAAHLPRYARSAEQDFNWPPEALARIEPINQIPEKYYLPQYRLNEAELSVMNEVYDQEIRYLDREFGKLIEDLKSDNALQNTILIITSDHGENFGEHGFIEHQFCLYNSLIRVPLIIIYPEKIEPHIIEQNVSTVSLFATISSLIFDQKNFPEYIANQTPLHQCNDIRPIFAEYSSGLSMIEWVFRNDKESLDFSKFDRDIKCTIVGDYKYTSYSDGSEELFDISRDPAETRNLIHQEEQILMALKTLLFEKLESADTSPMTEEIPKIDEETREALRALGYLP